MIAFGLATFTAAGQPRSFLSCSVGASIRRPAAGGADLRASRRPGGGWTKFFGEPVVSVEDFAHATNQTLELPPPAGARRISRFFGKADSGS
jgi:hypothetical protein